MENILVKDDSICYCSALTTFVINKGSKGPFVVDFLEVPKMSTKMQYVRHHQLAIWESFKTIKNPGKNHKTNKTHAKYALFFLIRP